MTAPPETYRLPIRHMVRVAGWHYRLTPLEVRSKSRKPKFVAARFAVAFVAGELGFTNMTIAWAIGFKEHSSVIHGRRESPFVYRRDSKFAALVDELRRVAADFAARGPVAWAEALAAREAMADAIDTPAPAEIIPFAPEPEPELECDDHADVDDDADAFAPFPRPHPGVVAMMQFGSQALLAAIRREHPERCAA